MTTLILLLIAAALALVNIGILSANILVLWITIKCYTEVLKIEHVKRIGVNDAKGG